MEENKNNITYDGLKKMVSSMFEEFFSKKITTGNINVNNKIDISDNINFVNILYKEEHKQDFLLEKVLDEGFYEEIYGFFEEGNIKVSLKGKEMLFTKDNYEEGISQFIENTIKNSEDENIQDSEEEALKTKISFYVVKEIREPVFSISENGFDNLEVKKLKVQDNVELFPKEEEKQSVLSTEKYPSLEIQKGTTSFDNFYIDATSGKLARNNNSANFQINQGTKIYIKDCGSGKIILKNYPNTNYAATFIYTNNEGNQKAFLGDIEIDTSEIQKTTIDDVEYYMFEAEDVSKYFISFSYIYKEHTPAITLNQKELNYNIPSTFKNVTVDNVDAKNININNSLNSGPKEMNFSKTWTASEYNKENKSYEKSTGYFNDIYIDATSGKIAPNSDWVLWNSNTKLYIPCSGTGTITISCYANDYTINCGKGKMKETEKVYSYDFTQEDIEILNNIEYLCVEIKNQGYFKDINVNYITRDYSIKLDKNGITSENLDVKNMVSEVDFQKGIKYKGSNVLFAKKVTQEEYDAIEEKDSNILYIIEE